MVRPVLDAVSQDIDGAALGDLALQPGQKLAPRRSVLVKRERFGHFGCVAFKEGVKLGQVDTVLAVVVARVATDPPGAIARGLFRHTITRRCHPARTGTVSAVQMSRSRPRSLVSVFMLRLPRPLCRVALFSVLVPFEQASIERIQLLGFVL